MHININAKKSTSRNALFVAIVYARRRFKLSLKNNLFLSQLFKSSYSTRLSAISMYMYLRYIPGGVAPYHYFCIQKRIFTARVCSSFCSRFRGFKCKLKMRKNKRQNAFSSCTEKKQTNPT